MYTSMLRKLRTKVAMDEATPPKRLRDHQLEQSGQRDHQLERSALRNHTDREDETMTDMIIKMNMTQMPAP